MAAQKALLRKIEAAFEAYFASKNLDCNIYTGVSNQVKEGPCIIIVAKGGPEAYPDSGNYRIHTIITTKGLADPDEEGTEEDETSEAKFNALDALVGESLKVTDLADQLNAQDIDEFTVIGIKDMGVDTDVEVIAWHSIREYEVYACESDL